MATQPPMMPPNHSSHSNSYAHTHRPHAQSSSSIGVGVGAAGAGGLYDDPTAWHSPSPFAATPSSLPGVPVSSTTPGGSGTSVSPVDTKHKPSYLGGQSTSPEVSKKAYERHGQALGLTQTQTQTQQSQDVNNGSRIASSSSSSEFAKGKEHLGMLLKDDQTLLRLGNSVGGVTERDFQS
ncbi:hypothetical protein IAU59_005783 [Kwoniella sp. CBS 9459]